MAGPIGREIFGAAQILLLVFNMGSHILTFTIMMNTVTNHGTCTIVFGIVGLALCFICTLPRKLGEVSYMAIVSFMSITAAVTVTMVGVGIEKPGHGIIDVTRPVSFQEAFLAVTNIIFAYSGHVSRPGVSEGTLLTRALNRSPSSVSYLSSATQRSTQRRFTSSKQSTPPCTSSLRPSRTTMPAATLLLQLWAQPPLSFAR